jgi:hypothetical protein
VYIHAAWLVDPTRMAGMRRFIQYAQSHPNTYFATVSQVSSAAVLRHRSETRGHCHPPWKKDIIVLTMLLLCVASGAQVLDWMKDPVPISQLKITCPTPTDMFFPSGRFCKKLSCVNGALCTSTTTCTHHPAGKMWQGTALHDVLLLCVCLQATGATWTAHVSAWPSG